MNTIIGVLTFQEYQILMNNIMNDEPFEPSMHMFWDFRDGTLSQLSQDDIEAISAFVLMNQERRGRNYRAAFAVHEPIDYGLSRMYQMISEDLPVTLQVFYDEQKASDWIKGFAS